ncbi:uncharacterized protein LOC144559520 [Carex rostrata]
MALQNSASPMYSDIDPRCEWVQGEDFNTLLVDVSGFKKEELKAQVDASMNLTVSGERNLEGNKKCRFQKSFQLPKACEISKVRAKLDNGVLCVMVPQPSSLDQTPSQDGNTTTTETKTGKQPANESKETKTGKQPANERQETSFEENKGYSQEGEEMQPLCNHETVASGVARNLLKQKLVILNVVIAATFLGLVLFRRYKSVDGDNISDHNINTLN